MTEEKLSKKADVRIYNFVNAIQPGLSKNTTYDEAWQILVNNCQVDGSLYTKDIRGTRRTTFKLFKNVENDNGEFVYEFNWSNKDAWNSTIGDWNWTYVFKTVIDYIIDNKIVKKPRAKKLIISKEKIKSTHKTPVTGLDELKRKKSSLYQKIREWKKKGKDVTELETEYKEIIAKLKSAI